MSIKLLSAADVLAMSPQPRFSPASSTSRMPCRPRRRPRRVIVVPEATVALPQSPVTEERAISVVPEPGGSRVAVIAAARNQTVYLTN